MGDWVQDATVLVLNIFTVTDEQKIEMHKEKT